MPWGPSDEQTDDGEEASGGWVPPEARTWRHPSELRAAQVAVALASAPGWRRGASVLVGTAALLAIAIGAALLASTGTTPGTVTLTTMVVHPAVTPCCTLTASATRDAEAAMVTLEPDSPHAGVTATAATAMGCGVVVGDGLVATTRRALRGARHVRIVSATGETVGAEVVATDPGSGLALLRTTGTLPAAAAPSAGDATAGAPALALSMQRGTRTGTGTGAAPQAEWTSGEIVSTGKAAPGSAAHDMAEIAVRGTSLPDVQGEPLVDRKGRLLGILDGARAGERWFLPMSLVTGVSEELETLGKVRHGWLGVTDATATGAAGTSGARILWVAPGSAAAGALRSGDVVVQLDGTRVTSGADLRSMLYVMSPGTKVALEARRDGRRVTAVVQLQPSP
ncbi:MAG: S1C family serine protease [Acidimicrobiales bacterium]